VATPAPPRLPAPEPIRNTIMFNLKAKLQKTRAGLASPLRKLFQRNEKLSPDDEDAIEELLLSADVGVSACETIMNRLREGFEGDYREFLQKQFVELLGSDDAPAPPTRPRALVVIGVNGVGKTTSIARLAHHLQGKGESVLLAACDTFRAAAAEQLAVWADRLGVALVRHQDGGDPAAVAHDACTAALARGIDTVIIDTAGRLHTKVNLMGELEKIKRVCEKTLGVGSVETYLTLDATLGQNSLVQAEEFTRRMHTDAIILTKLDGTARGGIVIAIKQSLNIPVRYIGVGEQLDDFAEFSAGEFVAALLE